MVVCPEHGAKFIHELSGKCESCEQQHKNLRVGKTRLQKQDRPLPYDHDAGLTMKAMPDNIEQAIEFGQRLLDDPVRLAQLMVMANRPPGVSKSRFNIAIRAAGREPMLNARPGDIRNGLNFNHVEAELRRSRLPKQGITETLYVKPLSLRNARYGHNAPYWGKREWSVFALKYGKGYVVRTDVGDESSVFNSVGALRAAIKGSGWDILKR